MQLDHEAFHLGVFGNSGNGKTEYALKFVTHVPSTCVFLFDAQGEFSRRMGLPPCRTPYEIDAAVPTGWVCFNPDTMFAGRHEEALAYLCKVALLYSAKLRGRKFIVIDELGWYCTGNSIPFPLKVIVQSGRRWGLDSVFIGQQPNELHNTVRSQLTEIVTFQLNDDTALAPLKPRGFDIEAVRKLPRFAYVCRNKRGAEVRG